MFPSWSTFKEGRVLLDDFLLLTLVSKTKQLRCQIVNQLVEDVTVELLGFNHNISLRYSYLYMHYVNTEWKSLLKEMELVLCMVLLPSSSSSDFSMQLKSLAQLISDHDICTYYVVESRWAQACTTIQGHLEILIEHFTQSHILKLQLGGIYGFCEWWFFTILKSLRLDLSNKGSKFMLNSL